MSEQEKEVIHTKIWKETAEADNPYSAKQCFCVGYDVYGDLLGKISWSEYVFLLFTQRRPTQTESKLLEAIAVAIANPGIRDHSVRAAMNAGVGGSSSASALMAALAVGAGQLGGAREVSLNMQIWNECCQDIEKWQKYIKNSFIEERPDVWLPIEHTPGFDPNGVSCSMPIKQVLIHLTKLAGAESHLAWLQENRITLEQYADAPLAMTGVISAAFFDLELNDEQGEMLFLMLRLPGAAVHALEQKHNGWRKYPFFGDAINLENDPGSVKN